MAVTDKRLLIIVPYRDRQAHLNQFVPHMKTYFERDKIDKDIPYNGLIVEQEDGQPFNRGMLKNIGFMLGQETSDYVCFHDVDYLPIWADYSWADCPTPILYYGAENRPIDPGRSDLTAQHNPDNLFGGALLVPNDDFRRINGFSNSYWGWGFEDLDMKARCLVAGIEASRRKGTFLPLDHVNEGFALTGQFRPIANVNRQLFTDRWHSGTVPAAPDGLSTTGFEVLSRHLLIEENPERPGKWEKVTVRLNAQPLPEQMEALAQEGR